jgi:predicted ATP-dependent endonuclease of OLD family
MYISEIKLKNFKGFEGEHTINFKEGMNFLIGNNNCGKSTLFEAVKFITSKLPKEEIITKDINDDVFVEVEFRGDDIEELLSKEPLKKYKEYLIKSKSLKIMRSSDEKTISQNGKGIKLDIDKIRIFNPNTEEFENPTGIDKTISALFDFQFVWADTNSDDITDFSKTKICGKIINEIIHNSVSKETWSEFEKSHKKTFNEICKKLEPVEQKIKDTLIDQYGENDVEFNFNLPAIEDFLKSGNINLTDNGIKTTSDKKGTGMQRALALAVIQYYADLKIKRTPKPLLFFIDEPETYLHPQAQSKLLTAFEKISNNSQFFIISHSPYLLKKFNKNKHSLTIFSKHDSYNKASQSEFFNLFGTGPSWGEINYYAFDMPTIEFHNELYGFIQEKVEKPSINDFDKYLSDDKHIPKDKEYIRITKNNSTKKDEHVTLPTFIRNRIHHPENKENGGYSQDELKKSIDKLVQIIKELK